MRVGIVGQKDNDRVAELVTEMVEALEASGVAVCVDAATATTVDAPERPVDEMGGEDLVVSIGGDGTYLFTARAVGTVPVLGVNLGEVGFLNAVSPEDAVDTVIEAVAQFRSGDLPIREVSRLRAEPADGDWVVAPAMNEIVVQGPQRGTGNGAQVEVRVDGSTYLSGRADGAMVATQTGSTAYNLSEGGPLVHPDVDGLVVTDMCAAASMPSLVVDADSEVTIRVSDAPTAYVVGDGRSHHAVETPVTVRVSVEDEPARLAGPRSDFFRALEKLD